MGIDRSVIRNDRKYSLISPFWLVIDLEIDVCRVDRVFGSAFSIQMRSSRFSDVLKLIVSILLGIRRCMVSGKNPRDVENMAACEGLSSVRFEVRLFSSSAMANPIIVTRMAVVFRYHGMVMTWIVVGGMLYEMKNPARILPRAKRLMGFINLGLFSLIIIRGGNRGLVIDTK